MGKIDTILKRIKWCNKLDYLNITEAKSQLLQAVLECLPDEKKSTHGYIPNGPDDVQPCHCEECYNIYKFNKTILICVKHIKRLFND